MISQNCLSPPSYNLLKKIGTADPIVLAQEVESVSFGGGCAGCSALNCATVADDCPKVVVDIRTKKGIEAEYVLNSQFTLRNTSVIIPASTPVEQPEEGEF